MQRSWTPLAVFALTALVAGPARAHVSLSATIDTAQETPSPTGVGSGAGGSATFAFTDEDGKLEYTVGVHGLTGDPILGHLHLGAPGTAGDIKVTLPVLPKNDGVAVTGSVQVPEDQVEALLGGLLYINFHTTANLAGEVRGQVLADPGVCSCKSATTPGQFKSCIKKEIRQLSNEARRDKLVKLLKRNAPLGSCGSKAKKQPKKKIACCLLLPGVESASDRNIANGHVCSPQTEKKCAKLGGTSLGAGSACLPLATTPNPCRFPTSPSGAFVD